LGENTPLRPGSEEYLNSEKYEIRHWDLDAPHSIAGTIASINRARHENPALHANDNLLFHPTDNPYLIAYSKSTLDGSNTVLTVVNLDAFHTQAGWVDLDLDRLKLRGDESFQVFDQLTGIRYLWQGTSNYVELRPDRIPAHLFRVLRKVRSEKDFDYYQ
jgi:starch synthase (maltosyl-transferring)